MGILWAMEKEETLIIMVIVNYMMIVINSIKLKDLLILLWNKEGK